MYGYFPPPICECLSVASRTRGALEALGPDWSCRSLHEGTEACIFGGRSTSGAFARPAIISFTGYRHAPWRRRLRPLYLLDSHNDITIWMVPLRRYACSTACAYGCCLLAIHGLRMERELAGLPPFLCTLVNLAIATLLAHANSLRLLKEKSAELAHLRCLRY